MSKIIDENSPSLKKDETEFFLFPSTDIISAGGCSNRMNYEEALQLCGGFGRFQTFITVVFAMGLFTGMQLINGVGFLTALPNKGKGYLCQDSLTSNWSQCTRDYICDSGNQNWRIDYDSPNSFRNWVDPKSLDLTCMSSSIIGLTGTAYFMGFMISSLLIPRLSDQKYARRMPYLISQIVGIVIYVLMFLSNSFYLNLVFFFGIGMCCGGRVCVGLSYLNEFIEVKYHNLITTLFLLGDSSLIYQAIFYMYVPDWMYVHSVAFVLAIGQFVCAYTIPESPKYMYVNRKYHETRELLKEVAFKNYAKITSEEIDNIVFEFEGIRDSIQEKFDVNTQDSNQQIIKLQGNVSEIFTIWQIRRNFICLNILLCTVSFCFFLINFQLKIVPGDMISLTLTNSIADMTGTLISGLVYNKLGAKTTHVLMSALAATGSIVLLLTWYNNNPRLILMCILLSKFGSAAVFNIVYIDFIVLSPTILTPTFFGICQFCARIFASMSSIFAEVDHTTSLSISIGFSLVQIIASIFLVTKLPRFI